MNRNEFFRSFKFRREKQYQIQSDVGELMDAVSVFN